MSKTNNELKNPVFLHSDNFHMIQRIACYVRDINCYCIPLIQSLGFTDYTIKDVVRWCSVGGKKRFEKDYYSIVGATNKLLKKVAKSTFDDSFNEFPHFSEIANDWILNAYLEINKEGRVMMSNENKQKLCSVYLHNERAAKCLAMLQDICKTLNEFCESYSDNILTEFIYLNESGHFDIAFGNYRLLEDTWADEFFLEMLNPQQIGSTPDWLKQLNENAKIRHDEAVAKSKALFNLD